MKNRILMGLDRGVWSYSIEQICKKCSELELDGLEVQPEHPEIFKDFPDVGKLKKTLEDYGFKLNSIHAPMKDINISSYNPRIRETSLLELKKTIKFAAAFSGSLLYVVMHGGQNSFRSSSNFEKTFLPKALGFTIQALKELIKDCEENQLTLSIENSSWSPWRISSHSKYLSKIFNDVPNLKFTFDYAHSYYFSNNYSIRMLNRFIEHLISIHIGRFFEYERIYRFIKKINPTIVIEPHHLKRRGITIFENLNFLINEIRNY
ncbi:MAG: sugar phosphate isomerase/epimerase family protein [Candidatus Helarchaeota archaeon]